ncbi:hypothetical protein BO83DRAFT_442112 [Aspergillus eucalypticola CBS 122712]|uniref:Uncharacterized protein n=1 Tax=Aspergillus eucalypticola (strain CBS 122712 / IBT 29274) TaxID=1448314 RepID=A0A317UKV7_ASPEC|nr:uncharacterized protein BO83DRAFT_442112 [Aspergillus eucalypticola CBS 122712]PWY62311.1 hypothetical protein BO83DRAFT_442112 [Aspergillus eucalypticola CBS 122712]
MRRLQKKKTSSSRTAAVQVSSDESLLTLGGWRAPYLLPGSMTAEKDRWSRNMPYAISAPPYAFRQHGSLRCGTSAPVPSRP